ncbi:MAG: 5'/3'-nucleotidase SurE, partial [Chloroflexi bacterium]|nr:5'/3'-nucleotidase SurE [Chloroflexota bacterium]
MHILVTNDDGVTAPGLAALAQAMRALGRVTVVAPDHNWSASGHVKTMHKPLRVKKAALADGAEALATDGAPSDCVALAFLGVVPDKIDMVVSGINPFANMSHDVTYSGTVMAAMEGAIARVPAVAVSVDGAATAGYETAAWAAARVVSRVAERGLPPYTLLNVNVPRVAVSDVKGFRITRQARPTTCWSRCASGRCDGGATLAITVDREPSAADRNFKLGVLNGLLFAVAETLMDPTLVLVAFVTHLSGSALLLGLVVPLRDGSWFLPQLWVSSYLQSWPRKLKLYRYMAALRFAVWSGLVLAVFFVKDPRWLLLMFFVFFGVGAVASGISGLPFLEVVGKTIPPKKLGLFFAWRQALGGLAGIVGSLVVGWMLAAGSPLAFPYNYGVLLGLGVILVAGGLAAFGNVSEPEDTATRPATSVLSQIRRGAQAFRSDGNFRYFISL